MRIQHNVMAMNAYRNYSNNTKALSKNLERLSSGYKINRAGDDAAGLAISEKMRAQITGLEAAQKNVKDGISLVNTAEGAMQEVQDMLNRMVYLAQESANGTYDNEVDRLNLQKEMDQLNSEIDRIADSANFNGIKLLDGSLGFNKEAFVVGDAIEAAAGTAVDGAVKTDMPAAVAAKPGNQAAANGTVLHKSGTEAQAGTFTVDLSQMKLESADGAKGDATITIGGVSFDIAAANNGDVMDGKAIATALKAEIDKLAGFEGIMVQANGTAAKGVAAAAGNKGALLYTATDNGDGTLTFTATKYSDGTAWVALDENLPIDAVADGACVNPGFDVTIAAKTPANVKNLTGNPNIDATQTQTPMKPGTTEFGNTYLELDLEKLAVDGNQFTIAGQTKIMGTDIKFDDLDLTDNNDKLKLMDRITQAFADNEHLTVGQDAGTPGKLTLSEKTDGEGNSVASEEMQKKMETLPGFKSLVSITTADTKAATKLTVNAANIKEGDGVTVGDTTYVFTDKADLKGTTTGKVKYLDKADAINKLKEALTNDGYNTTLNEDDPTILQIEAKTGTTELPAVLGKGLTLQIGDTSDPYNQLSVVIGDIHAAKLGTAQLSIADQQSAADAVDKIKNAINTISGIRGTLGATSNRLDHTANNLSVMRENITDAESAIRDTDIAEEMMAYTKNNILVQSAQAMLAQANQVPQGVLQLLQ